MIDDYNAKFWTPNHTYNYTAFPLLYQGFYCLIFFCNKSDIYYYWNKEILYLCRLENAIFKRKSSSKTKKQAKIKKNPSQECVPKVRLKI